MKRLIYPLLVCFVSLAALFVFLFLLGPKIEAMFRDVGGRSFYMTDWGIDATLQLGVRGHHWFWMPVSLTLALFLAALVSFVPEKIRLWSGRIFVVWSLGLFIFAGWCMAVGAIGGMLVAGAFDTEAKMYEMVLREQSLLELAQNRHSKTIELLGRMRNLRPVEMPVEQLTPKERRSRTYDLIRLMKDDLSIEMKKQMLASLWPLRAELKEGTREAERVLKIAASVTGTEFSDLEDFFAWLEPRLGHEGWVPVPAYRLVAPTDKP
jgi:hypothetical protein